MRGIKWTLNTPLEGIALSEFSALFFFSFELFCSTTPPSGGVGGGWGAKKEKK